MGIEITFTALTAAELKWQMLEFLHGAREEPKKRGRPPKAPAETQPIEDIFVEEEAVEAASVEPIEEDEEEQVDQTGDAIANEKLKAEVIESLHGLFTSGKVKVVRHVLNTYGNGAKSFPEIDASAFPAIKEALDRGEAA